MRTRTHLVEALADGTSLKILMVQTIISTSVRTGREGDRSTHRHALLQVFKLDLGDLGVFALLLGRLRVLFRFLVVIRFAYECVKIRATDRRDLRFVNSDTEPWNYRSPRSATSAMVLGG